MAKRKGGGERVRGPKCIGPGWAAVAVAMFFSVCGSAGAFEIQTGNKDIELRWDTTFRYNLAYRTESQNKAIIGNPNADDGDRNFDKGIVTNRLDLLSEFDLSYKKDYGFRTSVAGWYDQRYHDPLDNDSPATSNHLENGQPAVGLSKITKRYFAGPTASCWTLLRSGNSPSPTRL